MVRWFERGDDRYPEREDKRTRPPIFIAPRWAPRADDCHMWFKELSVRTLLEAVGMSLTFHWQGTTT